MNQLALLIVIWWAGAAAAGIALLLPEYFNYLIVAAAGWITVGVASGLIIYEIKKIKAEDGNRNSSELAS
jgi:hypothetical protein